MKVFNTSDSPSDIPFPYRQQVLEMQNVSEMKRALFVWDVAGFDAPLLELQNCDAVLNWISFCGAAVG